MNKDHKAQIAQEKVIKQFQNNPESALSTDSVMATIRDGFLCSVIEGDHELAMDLPPIVGGENSAPGPGVFARAALAGCILQVLKLTAVRKGINLQGVELGLEVDFDDSAMFGLGNNSSPVLRSRISIKADAELKETELQALVNESLELDPYFRAWRDSQEISVSVEKK